ncbi:MAG: aldolase/citrate lyase family protein [Pseudomonadales bacterium]|jgi:4-hydroxy-2-oxoheptanedioate aldolase|nr:aldolase/citrate lyase family protein [Pseudomonadales bacterium]MDP6472969.1 aldolase/citrate lyase family protein [Pseudomonadales bacterium]MDP6826275.1 aldolase/citrate lyase family protein [Pseudomonadales bacterium]MDP6972541.1 aldolase/citrate lyase family protein [Pseudomonadales bacterium]|tara:strand:+ start:2264 stop:3055 length:792 start_codon:yes stop_codon:yes gene_type:complete
MRENTALTTWREGGQTIGVWLSMANTYSAEMLANMGFDWVCVDLQHGLIDYQDLTAMLPAISTSNATPIVRVPWNEPYEIMKVLDVGAYGVIVPLVNNRREAEQAVAACRYPPDGNRSFGPIRAALYAGRGYAAEANEQTACIAMIETEEALENLDAIVSTPGLDGVYIGPSDLALAIGLPPQGDTTDEKHAATVRRIADACKTHDTAIGIHTSSLQFAQRYLEWGFNFVTLGSDAGFMGRAAAQDLAAARGTQQQEREKTGY